MAKQKHLAVSLALVLVAGLSCDVLTAPATTGGIDVVLMSELGTELSVGPRAGEVENPSSAALGPVVLLDAVRVSVNGPTSKAVTLSTTGGLLQLPIDDLQPGRYTVVVEGLVDGKVARYGETTAVNVVVGVTAAARVTFRGFQPDVPVPTLNDTAKVLRFPVSFSAVPNATSYIVEWSTSPTMADAQSKSVAETSTEINVPADGEYYYRVRAVNAAVAMAGLPSPVRVVMVFQTVATVTVSPASPTVTAGATQQFTFEARDADNSIVANPPVLWVSNNHTVATISPTGLATSLTSGTAIISAVAKGTPGTATLTANPMAPTKLVFTTQPGNTTAGVALTQVQVAIQNPQNQTATDNTTQITVAFGTNAGSGTLGGTKTVTVANGVATFTTLTVDRTGTGYTLSATATGLATATSTGFNITPAGADRLAFIVQPSTVTAGSPISPAVQVEVRDALGNRIVASTAAVTLAIGTNPNTGTLNGTRTVNAINGVASFSGLSIDRNGTGYTLTAASAGLTAATSAAFNIGAATQLAFVVDPTNSVAGNAFSPAIQVEVRDAAGNRVASANNSVTLAFGNNPSAGTLSGTLTVSAVNGIANFSGVSVLNTGIGYTLIASGSGLTDATSAAFNIAPGPLAGVMIFEIVDPQGDAITTDDIVDVFVRTRDANGNSVPAVVDVTLGLGANPGNATPQVSPTQQTSSAGFALFAIRIDKIGTGYTLVVRSSSLASGVSGPFDVVPGDNAGIAFRTPPTNAEPQETLNAIEVVVVDSHGNETGAEGIPIDIALGANPGGATLNGTLQQVTVGGVATFNDLSIDTGGDGYTLIASVPSTSVAATSLSLDVSMKFVSVLAGEGYTCGLTDRGSAYCWGGNGSGRLGNGQSGGTFATPQRVAGGHQFSSIGVGFVHACGVRATDHAALCWGSPGSGRLGNGVTAGTFNTPQLVLGGDTYIAIDAGENHTCGIRESDHAALCWGFPGNGQLGNNTDVGTFSTPQLVLGGHAYKSIAVAVSHTCGVRLDDVALCWGAPGNGRLGNNVAVGSFFTPQPVQGGHLFKSIRAKASHTCAIRTDDRAMCWGAAASGKLGNGVTTPDALAPVFVSSTVRFAAIAPYNAHTCAVALSGSAWCWGAGGAGQLGNAALADFTTPQLVVGNRVFTNIAPGGSFASHSCAVATNGAFCWGQGGSGTLGDGGTFNSSVPVRVKGSR